MWEVAILAVTGGQHMRTAGLVALMAVGAGLLRAMYITAVPVHTLHIHTAVIVIAADGGVGMGIRPIMVTALVQVTVTLVANQPVMGRIPAEASH
jgi:hypothetical protein